MSKCCVKGCTNTTERSEKTAVTFHSFPSNPQLRQEWMSALDISTPALSEQETVCSEHLPMFFSGSARANDSQPRVCRACLATDSRMCDMRQAGTLSAYCALLGLDTTDRGLPNTICYECSARLRKLQSFTAAALRANNYLLQMLHSQGEILQAEVIKLDRVETGLISPLKCSNIVSISFDGQDACKLETVKIERGGKETAEVKICEDNEEIVPKVIIDELPGETDAKIEANENDLMLFDNVEEYFPENDEVELAVSEIDIEQVKINDKKKINKRKGPKKKIIKKKKTDQNTSLKRGEDSSLIAPGRPPKKKSRETVRRYKNYKDDYAEFCTVTVMTEQESAELLRARSQRHGYLNAVHRCSDCYNPFSTREAYDRHRLRHEPSAGDHECAVCRLRMKSLRQLKKHAAMNHRCKFACKRCPHVCTLAQVARSHEETHTEKSYSCEDCNRRFNLLVMYKKHMHKHHPTEHPCAACGASYLGRAALRAHVARSHTDVTNAAGSARCSDCAVDFHSEPALQRHLATSSKHNAAAPQLACEACDETFPDRASAVVHRSTHRGQSERPGQPAIACELCDKLLAGSREYHHHFRREHRGATRTLYPAMRAPRMCELCGRVFQSQTALRDHRRQHTGERPHGCDICGKTFAKWLLLQNHARTHTKERPYKCDECGRTFSNCSNMNRHKAVHTDAKPYDCEICSKTFKNKRTANDHVKYVHLKTPWPKRDRSKRGARPAAAGPEAPCVGGLAE